MPSIVKRCEHHILAHLDIKQHELEGDDRMNITLDAHCKKCGMPFTFLASKVSQDALVLRATVAPSQRAKP